MAQQRRGEETRNRILEAAIDCFCQHGYDAASVAQICECAEVTKGGFYHHFPSKQALFVELMDRWLDGLDERLATSFADRENVPQCIMGMADMVGHVFEVASGRLPMFLEFWSQAAHDPDVWQATIAPYRWYRAFVAGLIEEGIDEGSLRPVDSQRAAQVLVALAIGLILQGLLDPEGADWGQATEDGVHMLLDGLRKRQEPGQHGDEIGEK